MASVTEGPSSAATPRFLGTGHDHDGVIHGPFPLEDGRELWGLVRWTEGNLFGVEFDTRV